MDSFLWTEIIFPSNENKQFRIWIIVNGDITSQYHHLLQKAASKNKIAFSYFDDILKNFDTR